MSVTEAKRARATTQNGGAQIDGEQTGAAHAYARQGRAERTVAATHGVQSHGVKSKSAVQTSPLSGVTETAASIAATYGEAAWLLGQSPMHRQLKIADLDWLIMPPLVLGQLRVFRVGDSPAGPRPFALAMWAWLTDDTAKDLLDKGRIAPDQWRAGTDVMDVVRAQQEKGSVGAGETAPLKSPEGKPWLVDLVCPTATADNKQVEACIETLIRGPLSGHILNIPRTDPKTGKKSVITVGKEG